MSEPTLEDQIRSLLDTVDTTLNSEEIAQAIFTSEWRSHLPKVVAELNSLEERGMVKLSEEGEK